MEANTLNKSRVTKNDVLFWLGLLFAVWFAWTGMVWIYWAALIIAYPIGLVSLVFWLLIRSENRKRTKWIPVVLSVGLILSLGMLTALLIWDN